MPFSQVFLTSAFLVIMLYTLFIGPVPVSLKKTVPEIIANTFPQSLTERKDSTECFYRQKTPYMIQLHQVNLEIFRSMKMYISCRVQFLTPGNDNSLSG